MRQRSQDRFACPPKERQEGRVAGEVAPQHHGVDQVSDDLVQLGTASPDHRGTHRNILLAGVAREQHLEGCQDHRVQGRAFSDRHGAQACRERLIQPRRMGGAPVCLHGRPRAIEGELERWELTRQPFAPIVPGALSLGRR